MCGIVGAVAKRDVTAVLLQSLQRLEYRGYDSAGVAIIDTEGLLRRKRVQGKVSELQAALQQGAMTGYTGIAHTRWATHGKPVKYNAHPHLSNHEIALVHNGIIENYESLREHLITLGYEFNSETDSEVIAHLIHHHLLEHNDLIKAVRTATQALEGAFALGVIHNNNPNQLIAVRQGSPLVIGIGDEENFIASDQLALLPFAKQFIYLEEGDLALIKQQDFQIFDGNSNAITRSVITTSLSNDSISKGEFRHFMLKEIFEQQNAITATIEGRFTDKQILPAIFGETAPKIFAKTKQIKIVACGTSYHAGLVARYALEEWAGVPVSVEIASEFRYRNVIVQPDTLFITLSQSGETADTLAALRKAKEMGYLASLAICNVPESSLVRESELVFLTRAGAEIGVASTKAFTTQLTALLMLVLAIGPYHQLSANVAPRLLRELKHLPALIQQALQLNEQIAELAEQFTDKHNALFLGRGPHYPIALEGALKLKEISYIHAEAYPAGELKHGPLALVDKEMPIIAVAPQDKLLEKLKSNLQEVRARGGQLYVFADKDVNLQNDDQVTVLKMPKAADFISPILYTIPLQLLAYHIAVMKGTDIDQPRNLAKSVTVE